MAALRSVAIGGRRVRVDDEQPTFWDRVEAGAWEPGTLLALAAHLGPGALFLDLGAWVGPLSLFAASLGARVVAVDADPRALEQLRRNLAANPDLAARVTVLPRAVAPQAGTVRLGARRKPGDSMSSVFLGDAATSWTAEAVAPDELGRMSRDGERLVVKLDIEGGEYALLPALAPVLGSQDCVLLASLHPMILAETGHPDPHGAALAALAPFDGWTSARVTPDGPVAQPLDRDALALGETWLLVSAFAAARLRARPSPA